MGGLNLWTLQDQYTVQIHRALVSFSVQVGWTWFSLSSHGTTGESEEIDVEGQDNETIQKPRGSNDDILDSPGHIFHEVHPVLS
jgi:hypothetical protein